MRRRLLVGLALGVLAGCATVDEAQRPSRTSVVPLGEAAYDSAPAPAEVPPDVAEVADAVPRAEPRSAWGNSPVYEVFGKSYKVLDRAEGFRESGIASWYGKRFHGRRTANGDTYDMYAMTAAHKSLPLPSYVRVLNPENGRSVVVRVNDRGPFYPGRIIDLSYAAAAKLGIVDRGHARVEIETVVPVEAPPEGEGWLQVAAYEDPINAVSMREELHRLGVGQVQIWTSEATGPQLHRVVVGPFGSRSAAEAALGSLRGSGLQANWIAN